jgi:cell shape-determining protein MreC
MNMTNFHRARQSSFSSSYAPILLVIGSVIIVTLLLTPTLVGPLTRLDATVWQTRYHILDSVQNTFTTKKQMQQTIDTLAERVNMLEAGRLSYHPPTADEESVPNSSVALVLSRPPQTPYDSILLDRGERDGVVVGQHIFASGSIILGSIDRVMATTARGVLYSAPDNEVTGYHHPSQSTVILQGRGGGGFEFQAPRQMVVTVGDVIIDQVQSDVIIAVIEKVVSDPRDPAQTVYARVPISLSGIRYVQIK